MTWKDGETISPLGLNRLEEAVAEMSQEYTPTVWAVGDKITAEKMNKLEQGVASISEGGGGGGSSDFSKVNVTLKVNEYRTADFNMFFTNPETGDVNGVYVTTEDNVRYISGDLTEIYLGGEDAEEKTFEAYSYLNNPIYALWKNAHSVDDYTITGDAEISTFTEQGQTIYAVTIYGDCTINVEGVR